MTPSQKEHELCIFPSCENEAANARFCPKHCVLWAASGEHTRQDGFLDEYKRKNLPNPEYLARCRVAKADFIRRTQAESQNAGHGTANV